MSETPKSNPIQEGLRLLNQCPVCKEPYIPDEANLLEQKETSHLVHITCPHCKNSILAIILVSALGMSSIGIITDLSATDVKRLKMKGPVTEDEVLDLHVALSSEKLFNQFKKI